MSVAINATFIAKNSATVTFWMISEVHQHVQPAAPFLLTIMDATKNLELTSQLKNHPKKVFFIFLDAGNLVKVLKLAI